MGFTWQRRMECRLKPRRSSRRFVPAQQPQPGDHGLSERTAGDGRGYEIALRVVGDAVDEGIVGGRRRNPSSAPAPSPCSCSRLSIFQNGAGRVVAKSLVRTRS